MASKLLRTKSPDHLTAEAATPERQMKRVLGPFALTCIGIGASIGTGIFALAGTAAAGEQLQATVWKTPILNFIQSWATDAPLVFGRPGAGPAVMLSFVVAAVACCFAALCYAELASMIPVSGSANTIIDQGGEALTSYSSTTLPVIAGHAIAVNLPALLIVAAVTWLLIYGIRESARTNNVIVITKVAVVVFVISFGAFLIHPTNWHPFVPTGIGGVMSGAAIVFFAFIGFDAVSTTAEETKNPQRDM